MTNVEIIEKAKKAHGIEEEVNTYQGWKRDGKQVQKGEKALFATKIWKPLNHKKDDEEVKEADIEESVKMIMVKAYFFGSSQVSK